MASAEVQKWMCIDLVNSDSAVVAGPRVTDFPTVPDVKYEKLTQSIARVTHVYSEGYELMVPPNATIQVTCSQVKIRSPTFNCSHDYLMINSERPTMKAHLLFPGHPKQIIDLIKHVEFTLDVSGTTHREETDFVILAPKKSFVVMSCPVFEVSDYWPCRQSYITVELQRYCHFPTAHKVEIEIPPTSTASINVKLASSPKDRVQCVLHRIAAQICVNMVASPIVKIVSPFRDDMETEMDMTVRYDIMVSKEQRAVVKRLFCCTCDDTLCGHSRPRDFTYSYGSVEERATYSLTYKKQRGVRQGHFSCFLYREPQTKVSLGVSVPGTATTKPSRFPQGEEPGTFSSSVSIIRTTEASMPSEAPGEPTNVMSSSSLGVPETGTVTGQPTVSAPLVSVPPGVTETFATGVSAFSSPGESLPPGAPTAYPPAFSAMPTTEVSLPSGMTGQPSIVSSISVGVSEPGTVTAYPVPQPEGEEESKATFSSGVSALPTTEVPAVTLGVSIPEITTGTPLPRTVETRTLPELSTSEYPHGISGEPKTGSPFMPGTPPLSSGAVPTLSGAVDVETKTGTGGSPLELHEATTQPSIFSVMSTTEIQSLPGSPFTPATEGPGASVPSGPIPGVSALTTTTSLPPQVSGITGPQEMISTTFPPDLINPETDEIRILLTIIRSNLKVFKVNATVLHVFLIKATTVGTHEAYSIILLALKDLKSSCKYLAPSERIKVAYEIAHYLKSHGTRIAHHVVVSAVGVFLCAVDHKDIITKLLSENIYMISISESVASELSCPDMEHLVHLLYADRNRTKVEESPCAGILCEEVPENVMDTIDMLVDRYFPQKAHEKKWLMLDIAKALNLQPEEDEDGDEMVYYKMGDYDVFLEELREPTISDEEKALLFGKYFAEVRKVAKAERKLRLDDLEEVWKMGGGKLPQPAVRSFIALLKLVHSKRISLKTEERIRLLKLALKCDAHECQKLSSSDIHNLIFALCNVGIRDGFGLPKDLKSQVTRFILTLKDNYIDSISIRRWKRSSSLLKPKSHDYLSASSPSELRYLKDWLQKPMSFIEKKPLLKNTGRSNDDPSGNGQPVLSQLYSAYVGEKRPDIKTVLAERLLDTYNSSFKHLGNRIGDTEKFVLSVVQQLPSTTARHNDLVLGILKQCIEHGDPCLNVTRNEHVAPVKVILQNMSLKQSPNFVPELSHDLFAAARKQRADVDLSWLTDSSAVRQVSQAATPPTLQMPSRAS
ncbi:hypothetical protein V5799_029403 [Amblyomma americanum]|uniref:Uncharacterized protein n=1 Tax=Amblyomma americanum TaxID=6943 RepID=A0AAQ4ERK0_AMBAM